MATTITKQELEAASTVISQWINEDIRNYAGLADMLRDANIAEQSVGVIILELMSATKLSEWQSVLAGLTGRQLVNRDEQNAVGIEAQVPLMTATVWERAYQKWNIRYRDAAEDEWTLGSQPTIDVVRAVSYFQQSTGNVDGALALDIGAGDGRHAVYLAEQGFHLVAIDAAEEAIHRLEHRLADARATLYHADLAECELPSNVDLLVASYILHLLPAPFSRLNEWQAAVRPGGFIVVSSRGRMHFDPSEYWFPPAGALQHYFDLLGWDIFSTREETEFREKMGMFRHTAVVARKPEHD